MSNILVNCSAHCTKRQHVYDGVVGATGEGLRCLLLELEMRLL
jgi:hypothetical protein